MTISSFSDKEVKCLFYAFCILLFCDEKIYLFFVLLNFRVFVIKTK